MISHGLSSVCHLLGVTSSHKELVLLDPDLVLTTSLNLNAFFTDPTSK